MKIKAYNKTMQLDEVNPRNIPDCIVRRPVTKIEYDEEGNEIKKISYQEINLTQKINETSKLIKTKTAEEKIAEIEKIFSK